MRVEVTYLSESRGITTGKIVEDLSCRRCGILTRTNATTVLWNTPPPCDSSYSHSSISFHIFSISTISTSVHYDFFSSYFLGPAHVHCDSVWGCHVRCRCPRRGKGNQGSILCLDPCHGTFALEYSIRICCRILLLSIMRLSRDFLLLFVSFSY